MTLSQQQVHRHEDEDEPTAQDATGASRRGPTDDDLDALLEELDENINFEEAEEFVRHYVQKPGQ